MFVQEENYINETKKKSPSAIAPGGAEDIDMTKMELEREPNTNQRLYGELRQQIDFYMSNSNLSKDKFLVKLLQT